MAKTQEKPHIGELVRKVAAIALTPVVGCQLESSVVISLKEVRLTALRERLFWRSLRAYFSVTIDDQDVYTSAPVGDTTFPRWDFGDSIECKARPSSVVKFTVLRDGKVRGTRTIGEFEAPLYIFLTQHGEPHNLVSNDSPDSCIFVHMTVDVDGDYLSCGLNVASNRLTEAQNSPSAVGVLGSLMECIQMLGGFGQYLANSHPILNVASVMLAAVYKTLTAHSAVNEEIKLLAKAMQNLLREAYKYKSSKHAEQPIREIILLVLEGASLMDNWSHTSILLKPFNAAAVSAQVQTCEDTLEKLKSNFEVVKGFCRLGKDVDHIGVQVDDGFSGVKGQLTEVNAQLASLMDTLTQMRNEDGRAIVKTVALEVRSAVYDQGTVIVPVTV
ncbi:hypothetical protein PsYK624_075980 [Phanerochaete sordida]|uniref:C2 domain-containing protein n=1 Tax=Phanerochaete sordida TaxID=48140 RepID=A0A9P3GAQ7_9APHY|nr:hypothetical protein PsYK624_075980 [Phanerochaete sordida]